MKRRRRKHTVGQAQAAPVRNLTKASPQRMTGGWHIEDVTPYDAQHQSPIEKKALWLLALCHDVLEIRSQPSRVSYLDSSGKDRHHIPDFVVGLREGPLYVEVKALANLVRPDSLDKFLAVAKAYLRQNKRFAFLVDAQLEEEPLFEAISILRRYVNCDPTPNKAHLILNALNEGPLPKKELLKIPGVELVDIFVMLARKQISWDSEQSVLNDNLLLSLPGKPFEGIRLANILRTTRYGHLLEDLALGRRPSDKSGLAHAAAWRQSYQPVNPYQFFGGFVSASAIRDIGVSESSARKAWDRRDQAPGAAIVEAQQGK